MPRGSKRSSTGTGATGGTDAAGLGAGRELWTRPALGGRPGPAGGALGLACGRLGAPQVERYQAAVIVADDGRGGAPGHHLIELVELRRLQRADQLPASLGVKALKGGGAAATAWQAALGGSDADDSTLDGDKAARTAARGEAQLHPQLLQPWPPWSGSGPAAASSPTAAAYAPARRESPLARSRPAGSATRRGRAARGRAAGPRAARQPQLEPAIGGRARADLGGCAAAARPRVAPRGAARPAPPSGSAASPRPRSRPPRSAV